MITERFVSARQKQQRHASFSASLRVENPFPRMALPHTTRRFEKSPRRVQRFSTVFWAKHRGKIPKHHGDFPIIQRHCQANSMKHFATH